MVLRLSRASFDFGLALRSGIGAAIRAAVTQLCCARAGTLAFGSPSHGGSIVVYGRSHEYDGGNAAFSAVVRTPACR